MRLPSVSRTYATEPISPTGWRSETVHAPGSVAALFGEQAIPLAGPGTPLVAEIAPAITSMDDALAFVREYRARRLAEGVRAPTGLPPLRSATPPPSLLSGLAGLANPLFSLPPAVLPPARKR